MIKVRIDPSIPFEKQKHDIEYSIKRQVARLSENLDYSFIDNDALIKARLLENIYVFELDDPFSNFIKESIARGYNPTNLLWKNFSKELAPIIYPYAKFSKLNYLYSIEWSGFTDKMIKELEFFRDIVTRVEKNLENKYGKGLFVFSLNKKISKEPFEQIKEDIINYFIEEEIEIIGNLTKEQKLDIAKIIKREVEYKIDDIMDDIYDDDIVRSTADDMYYKIVNDIISDTEAEFTDIIDEIIDNEELPEWNEEETLREYLCSIDEEEKEILINSLVNKMTSIYSKYLKKESIRVLYILPIKFHDNTPYNKISFAIAIDRDNEATKEDYINRGYLYYPIKLTSKSIQRLSEIIIKKGFDIPLNKVDGTFDAEFSNTIKGDLDYIDAFAKLTKDLTEILDIIGKFTNKKGDFVYKVNNKLGIAEEIWDTFKQHIPSGIIKYLYLEGIDLDEEDFDEITFSSIETTLKEIKNLVIQYQTYGLEK